MDVRLETVRQRREPVERADPLQRGMNILVARVRMRDADVVRDRAAEQMSLLRQHHDPPVQ